MSQAEELLNGMSEEIPVHTHPVPDTDAYFVIDPITKQIENTNRRNTVIMQYTHNSERLTFELPRYIDGHDMLECTSVTVNANNIEVVESDGVEEVEPRVNPDAPDITDLRIHPTDPEKVICSWLISRNSTQLAGILSFHVEFKCADSNGNVVYEWSTDNYDEIEVRARKKNGEAAVVEYTDLLEQWRTRIFGAGDSVMANIAAEGEAQVAAVKAESETQQEAVELKGAQTLETIPEDYTEVDAMADEAVRSKGDAIVCEASGESIVLKDSSNDHIRGLKLFGKSTQFTTTGKNKLNLGQISERTVNGVALTPVYDDNGNLRYLNINGTATNTFLIHTVPFSIAAGTYKFTNFVDRTTEDGTLHAQICDSEGGILYPTDKGLGGTFTFETDSNLQYRIYIHEGRVANYEKIYPMLRDASIEDSAYEPYTGGKPAPNPDYPQEIVSAENPTVSVCGKNLLIARTPNKSASGVTFTVNADNSVTIDGVSTSATFFNIDMESPITYQGVNLIASLGGGNNAVYMTIGYFDKDGGFVDTFVTVGNDEKEFVYPQEAVTSRVYIFINDATTFNNVTVYPMIRLASVDDKYEIGKELQSINIHRTLPGIPVTSGGNYTDSDGQQWICDEIDLERGVYVQRIITHVFDGSSDEHWVNGYVSNGVSNRFEIGVLDLGYIPCSATVPGVKRAFCNSFRFSITNLGIPPTNMFRAAIDSTTSAVYLLFNPDTNIIPFEDVAAWRAYVAENPIVCCLPVNTPIETPLTAEEITAFKTLRTNHPNTTILNDAGAWMSVKYNADTRTYVENPKTLKLVDSSTGVVYELKIVDGAIVINPV